MSKRNVSLKDIKAVINKLDQYKENSDSFNTQVILLSAVVIGANADRIAKFTKLPRKKVRTVAKRLTQGGIWKHGKTYADWENEDGDTAFLLDTLVAEGLLERSPEVKNV